MAAADSPAPVLKHSDVVFMNQAGRDIYAEYGATVVAWGGTPNSEALDATQGALFFGSVGMVTEFARYHDRFPETYEQGLCRDVEGQPIKVPWLTDHQHRGIPYWWCCTQQPLFRQFLRERVIQTVKAGAAGVHLDDHLGTAGGVWTGTCFCDRCVEGFREFLETLPASEREKAGVAGVASFDYRERVRAWLKQQGPGKTWIGQRPLYDQWRVYQCRQAARFMAELRELAARTAGRPVPMSANAGVLWPTHLVDYKSLDFFSAEVEQGAGERRPSDVPILGYRLAEAVGRPLAATASGQDWAFVKEHRLHGLAQTWIAAGYAAGHFFMAPHRQWCYTPEKGTHWYDGPREKFAPLYRFVRGHARLFDGYATQADVAVLLPHAAFMRDAAHWFKLSARLAAAHLSYRVLLAGDDLVDRPLAPADFRPGEPLIASDTRDLAPEDAGLLQAQRPATRVFASADEAIAKLVPAIRVEGPGTAHVRALARVKPGSAVVHLLNHDYDPAQDSVRPIAGLKVTADLRALGLRGRPACTLFVPGSEPRPLAAAGGTVTLPDLGLWAMLLWETPP